MTHFRLQDYDEPFEQEAVNPADYFSDKLASGPYEIGKLKWFCENDHACITQLRIKDGARSGYEDEWHESGVSVLHRVPSRGRERKLLKAQADIEFGERTPFDLIRMIGTTAYNYGKYIVVEIQDGDGRGKSRGGVLLRRIVYGSEVGREGKSQKPTSFGEYIKKKKKLHVEYPKFPPTTTREPVKSSSEGRHLNMLKSVFGCDNVFYEPASFKVKTTHMMNYTPDFMISGKLRNVVIESKSRMSDITGIAIQKAWGVQRLGLPTFFLSGPPCDLMVWKLHQDVPAILPTTFDEIVFLASGNTSL